MQNWHLSILLRPLVMLAALPIVWLIKVALGKLIPQGRVRAYLWQRIW